MNNSFKFKLLHSVINIVILILVIFGDLSPIVNGFLVLILGGLIYVSVFLDYWKEWKANGSIKNKSKFIRNIILIIIYLCVMFWVGFNCGKR